MKICLKPRGATHLLKFRRELEAVAKANDVPVTFSGMLGAIIIEGEPGHLERFMACVDATAERVQREGAP